MHWTDGFWRQHYDQCRKVTLRKLWELASDPDSGHVLDNMRIGGGLAEEEFAGTNGDALYRPESPWNTDLYRKVERQPIRPLPIRMIPYFAWANRGPSAMSAWLPVVWSR